jgi:hypothetical protein
MATTAAAAAAETTRLFRRLWPNRPQAPHFFCLGTGLSIELAGLYGDDMVDEKFIVVFGATM